MDEDIWRDIFRSEMQDKGIYDLWDFSVDEHFQAQKGWLQYSLCCFARFCCSICGRDWASSKVCLLFHMKLKFSFGRVKMHIYRQKCKVCNSANYEEPVFLVENVEVAMKCLVNRICQKFYKLPIEDFPRNFVRDGRQDGPHDRANCEACAKGMCNCIKNQENQTMQQIFTYPEDIYTTYNTPSRHQQSWEDIEEVTRPYSTLSYSPRVPQYTQTSQHSRQEVGLLINNPSVPQLEQKIPERQSECCCIICCCIICFCIIYCYITL